METRHQSFGSSFPRIVYQLRTIQITALFLEMAVLYMESDRIGLRLLFPLFVHVINFYHTGKRLYYNIDGRFDFSQVLSIKDNAVRVRYAFAVFGSLALAIFGHFVAGQIPSSFSSVIYNLSDYASITASAVVIAAEVYETIKSKLR